MIHAMKTILLTALLLTPLAALHAAEWELVWSDEFDYQGLPDPQKWDYEDGFVRNHEAQYYTRGRLENARVENGTLIIEGRKEKFKLPEGHHGKREFAEYTAASLITLHKASWRYGRVEVRAKIPQGKGMWPAIWMLGISDEKIGWPRCGEIDIMESVGKEPDNIYATVHYQGGGKHRSSGSKHTAEAPYKDFHLYAMEWYPDRMDFYFDTVKYHTFRIDDAGKGAENPFRKPQYLLMNLAIGGDWGGPIDDSFLPQKYIIDYVRVYKQKD